MDEHSAAAQSIWRVGIRGLCPRCGRGKLFNGFLKLAPKCNACGLDYSFADPADGPAFFVMMTMAFPATGFGMWIELAYEPPLWVHFVTTLPFLLLSCVPILRPIKGVLVASQYINKAEEGRLVQPDEPPPSRVQLAGRS
ncbi:membrane protein [Labrys miyagiensis]